MPHASGLLDGKYTRATKFDSGDHRSFRKQQWLDKSMTKVEMIDFLFADKDARPSEGFEARQSPFSYVTPRRVGSRYNPASTFRE